MALTSVNSLPLIVGIEDLINKKRTKIKQPFKNKELLKPLYLLTRLTQILHKIINNHDSHRN